MYQLAISGEYKQAPYYDFTFQHPPSDNYFLSADFVKFVAETTKIDVKEMYEPFISRTLKNGYYGWHTDKMRHGEKVTAIYYMNKYWDKDWGAILELQDGTLVEPLYNRLVLMPLEQQQLHRVTTNVSDNFRYAFTGWLK